MRIVDLHNYRGSFLYCGRGIYFHRTLEAVRVNSPLRNPYSVKRHGALALPMFQANLFWQIERQVPAIMEALASITADSILGCWCVNLEGEAIFTEPETCHCQLIWKAWRWLNERQ